MSFYAPGDELVAFDAFPTPTIQRCYIHRKDYEGFFLLFPDLQNQLLISLPLKSQAILLIQAVLTNGQLPVQTLDRLIW